MRTLAFIIFTSILFIGCTEKSVTKADCLKKGLAFKSEKSLNYRTGKYQNKSICIKKG